MSAVAATRIEHTETTPVPDRRTTLRRVVRSEWVKLRSLRSTWLTMAATLVVIVGFGAIASMVAGGEITTPNGGAPGGGADSSPLGTVLAGANLAVLIVAVLGSIVGAREFGTGMIRTTLSAVPKRVPVLWSKLATFTAVVLPIVAVGVVAAFFLGMSLLAGSGSATLSWTDDSVARSVVGTALYITGLGIIGLALGVLLRSTAAAIGVGVGVVLFLPALASALLPSSWDSVLKFLPSNAGAAFTSLGNSDAMLSPGVGAAVFAGWVALAIAGAAFALIQRDA